jgi:hypothetical protein
MQALLHMSQLQLSNLTRPRQAKASPDGGSMLQDAVTAGLHLGLLSLGEIGYILDLNIKQSCWIGKFSGIFPRVRVGDVRKRRELSRHGIY